ncbi:hypothetical protein PCYB_003550 [Plasmodium cynomolgi strain B]|uniref:VIR protein n=1 Tax=Plasmodium cynomolgi (strain B) TaxID=1120755 RepID=K6UF74_PLACD|nr:hypothetical protein PCYB_003550 [Plasmodium cynomolgi strain B]GAB69606.1 hypothetical protein PCYB_003550 [Plasmodium cynomolgi strain B]
MACKNDTGKYFDYNCYYELKNYYESYYSTSKPERFLDQYKIPDKYNHIYKKFEVFIPEVIKYFAYDRFSYESVDLACKYINYWLQEQIRKENTYALTEEDLDFFKSLADDFAKFEYGCPACNNNTCSKFFSYLPLNKYTIINTLYNTYALYNELKDPSKKLLDEYICSNFLSIRRYYRELLLDNIYDEELYNKLNNFRTLVQNEMNKYTGKCSNDLSLLMPLIQYTPPLAKNSDRGEGNSGLPSETRTQLNEKLEEKFGTHTKTGSQGEKVQLLVDKSKLSALRNSDILQQTHVLSKNEEHRENMPINDLNNKTFTPVYLPKERQLTESSEHIGGTIYQPNNVQATSSSPDGIVKKINGAFSGISEYVDAAPLMGVSGGMGALYLLLRYTPVGSYFGRRRSQIRRNVEGLSSGEFPNFSEYDGGYIRYGPMNISSQAE